MAMQQDLLDDLSRPRISLDAGSTTAAVGKSTPLPDFILSFVRAILKTGYYEDDHPESQKARAGLYFELLNVLMDQPFISFSVVQLGDKETVVLGGVLEEPQTLKAVLRHEGGDLFAPKVHDLLAGKGIFSISLLKGITEGEFDAIIKLLSRSSNAGHGDDEGLEFSRAATEACGRHLLVIPMSEVKRARRRMPWRVQILMSRMTRDLRNVPVIRGYSADQVSALYQQVIVELFRPIKDPGLLRDAILNLDLVLEELKDISNLDPVVAAANAVPQRHVLEVLPALVVLRDRSRKRIGAGLTPEQESVAGRVALIFIDRLISADDHDAYPLLEQMFAARVVRFERLPVRLKTRIASEQMATAYLADPEALLARLRACTGAQECPNAMEAFVIADWLLRKGRIGDATLILKLIFEIRGRHTSPDPTFLKVFDAGLSLIRTGENMAALKPLLASPKKADRLAAIEVAGFFGAAALDPLLAVMRESEDRWVRKSVIESLGRLGEAVVPAARASLADPAAPWFMKRNMLLVLSQTGDASLAAELQPFTSHGQPRIREAAIEALYFLTGDGAERAILEALDDPDEGVKRKAIALLLGLGNGSPRFLSALAGLLLSVDPVQSEGLQLAAVDATCHLADDGADPSAELTPEQILVQALGLERGLIDRLLRTMKGTRKSDPVRIAIADCLGRTGTARARPALESLAADPSPEVAKAARKALESLKHRR